MVSKHFKKSLLFDSLVTWSTLFFMCLLLVLVNQCPSICLTGDILSYFNSIESPDRGLAGLLLSISIEI